MVTIDQAKDLYFEIEMERSELERLYEAEYSIQCQIRNALDRLAKLQKDYDNA